MQKFIPRQKLSKKAKRDLDGAKRQLWEMNPVTRTARNKKKYNRKNSGPRKDDYGSRSFCYIMCG